MPALNEEKNVRAAIANVLAAFDDYGIRGELIVIDDGSTDRTGEIIAECARADARVSRVRHESPRGIGGSFWDGVDRAAAPAVTMLPGDNENDPWEILRYCPLLEHVDIVIPFVFNREARPLWRNALSYLYRFIVNSTFFVNFNYTNGTVLYRKSLLQELPYRSSGFFFQSDILVRTVKRGYLFAEVPYRLGMRREGLSKAVTFPSLVKVMRGYLHLVKDYYFVTRGSRASSFARDSRTAERHADAPEKKTGAAHG
jgi:glycosyltransferase involved in cell wall biosynthesis